ncbi:MAG: PIN domain-containing protein [Propionibacteriaceae bacterium]|jgi:predicted nucleic acid-binding protein|nr:PIN domain-containing protein [Propionibacteriaceae bacterium]
MRVLLDTNVVLDALLARSPWHDAAADLLRRAAEDAFEPCVTATSVTDIFYIARRNLGSAAAAKDRLAALLQIVTVLDVTSADCHTALASPLADYEDAVQAASAARHRVTWIATRDTRFTPGPVPVISPADLLEQLRPAAPA